jgi:hypothetical protein
MFVTGIGNVNVYNLESRDLGNVRSIPGHI